MHGWVGGWVGWEGEGERRGGRRINPHTDSLEQPWPPGAATGHPPCREDAHGAMAVALGHGSPTGAHQRRHSLNRDITGSENCPPEKQTS